MTPGLIYAQRGWKVVPLHHAHPDGSCTCEPRQDGKPCPSPGKHPRLKDWPAQATSDAGAIEAMAARFPGCNWGIATGAASGFFVLDVDPKNGGDVTLAELVAKHGPLPRTVKQETPSGGAHYLFKLPKHPVSNARVGDGLDIRGDGGQIVAAPSTTPTGQYRWALPPWEAPIADAPAWLLERLGRGAAATTRPDESARGYFPPAAPDVLEEAREALARHGPAVDGDNGGKHTVHAGAILTHDFALTDEEAWPLFVEWNGSCEPPWELDELRERLRRGRKYGKAEYGARRPLETVQAVKKRVADWQAAGANEAELQAVVAFAQKMTAACGDSVRYALIERELVQTTGLSVRALALPKPKPPPVELKPGEIRVTPRLDQVADEALAALAPHVFARNGELVEVVAAERTFLHTVGVPRIMDLMSRSASFVRQDEQRGLVHVAPPEPVARILHGRRTLPGVRVLESVTSAPVFLPDGSILQDRGYSESGRVFLEPSVRVDVPSAPDLEDARAAVELFRDLLCDFRFASPADFSSWLAALLSPLVKAATGNASAPLTCISASSPGAGKTMLAELIALIVTGAGAEVRPYNPGDASEHGKRLTAFVKAASPVNVFDNVNGDFGDAALDRLVTSKTWSDRQLGASDAPPLPVVGTWIATGNNIAPVGDTVRRVLMVRLDVHEERPQEREGFRRPLLSEYVQAHRAELLGAALTILRAYHCAGRPNQGLASWGSFVEWGALVRGALVWAGCADPFETQRRASLELNEPENDAHDFWLGAVEACDGTAAGLALVANQRGAQEVLGARDTLTPHAVRRWVGRFVDRPRGGRRIRKRVVDGRTRYVVEKL